MPSLPRPSARNLIRWPGWCPGRRGCPARPRPHVSITSKLALMTPAREIPWAAPGHGPAASTNHRPAGARVDQSARAFSGNVFKISISLGAAGEANGPHLAAGVQITARPGSGGGGAGRPWCGGRRLGWRAASLTNISLVFALGGETSGSPSQAQLTPLLTPVYGQQRCSERRV